MTFEHLRDAAITNALVSTHLHALVNTILGGNLPASVANLLTASRLIALAKPGGGARPITIGECLTRLAAKAALSAMGEAARVFFLPLQYGVAVPGGAETVIHAARAYLDVHPTSMVLQADIANAFNSVLRHAIATALQDPALSPLLPFVKLTYGNPSQLLLDVNFNSEPLQSERGVRLGDPLGPLLFAAGIHATLRDTTTTHPDVLCLAYADDVTLLGNAADTVAAFHHFTSNFTQLGLAHNPSAGEFRRPRPWGSAVPVGTAAGDGKTITTPEESRSLGRVIAAHPLYLEAGGISHQDDAATITFARYLEPVGDGFSYDAIDRLWHPRSNPPRRAISRLGASFPAAVARGNRHYRPLNRMGCIGRQLKLLAHGATGATGTLATGATGTLATGATGTRAIGVTGSAANSERQEQRTHGRLEQRAHGRLAQRAHGQLAQRSHGRLELRASRRPPPFILPKLSHPHFTHPLRVRLGGYGRTDPLLNKPFYPNDPRLPNHLLCCGTGKHRINTHNELRDACISMAQDAGFIVHSETSAYCPIEEQTVDFMMTDRSSGAVYVCDVTITDPISTRDPEAQKGKGWVAREQADKKVKHYAARPETVNLFPLAVDTYGCPCAEVPVFMKLLADTAARRHFNADSNSFYAAKFLHQFRQRWSMALQRAQSVGLLLKLGEAAAVENPPVGGIEDELHLGDCFAVIEPFVEL
ncbi:unnamed protein product [Closterium sp. NIES-54]